LNYGKQQVSLAHTATTDPTVSAVPVDANDRHSNPELYSLPLQLSVGADAKLTQAAEIR
jgi:hypothetical protein